MAKLVSGPERPFLMTQARIYFPSSAPFSRARFRVRRTQSQPLVGALALASPISRTSHSRTQCGHLSGTLPQLKGSGPTQVTERPDLAGSGCLPIRLGSCITFDIPPTSVGALGWPFTVVVAAAAISSGHCEPRHLPPASQSVSGHPP